MESRLDNETLRLLEEHRLLLRKGVSKKNKRRLELECILREKLRSEEDEIFVPLSDGELKRLQEEMKKIK